MACHVISASILNPCEKLRNRQHGRETFPDGLWSRETKNFTESKLNNPSGANDDLYRTGFGAADP